MKTYIIIGSYWQIPWPCVQSLPYLGLGFASWTANTVYGMCLAYRWQHLLLNIATSHFQCRRTTQQEIWPWESLFEHSDWFFTITVTSPCLLCVCQFRWVCDGWKSSNNSLSTGTLFLFFRCASSRASLSPNAQVPVVQARSTLMSWLTKYLIDYLIIIV